MMMEHDELCVRSVITDLGRSDLFLDIALPNEKCRSPKISRNIQIFRHIYAGLYYYWAVLLFQYSKKI